MKKSIYGLMSRQSYLTKFKTVNLFLSVLKDLKFTTSTFLQKLLLIQINHLNLYIKNYKRALQKTFWTYKFPLPDSVKDVCGPRVYNI